jgi:hypothetical protein
LASHICLGLPIGLFPSGFLTKTLHDTPHHSSIHATCPAHFSLLHFLIQLILGKQ